MDNIFTMSRICHIKYSIFAFKKHYSWKVCITRAPWFSTSINSMQYCNTRLPDEYSYREYTSPLTSLSRHHIIYEGYLENNDTLIIFLYMCIYKLLILKSRRLLSYMYISLKILTAFNSARRRCLSLAKLRDSCSSF